MSSLMKCERLRAAVTRNLGEATLARYERVAIEGMVAAGTQHSWDFFAIVERALFNDMVAHAIKVLDRNPESATLWYILRCMPKELAPVLATTGLTRETLETLAVRLKGVRDEVHFHIDRDAVKNPDAVWERAGITGSELASALDAVITVLMEAHRLCLGEEFELPAYDGSDATRILEAASAQGLLKP